MSYPCPRPQTRLPGPTSRPPRRRRVQDLTRRFAQLAATCVLALAPASQAQLVLNEICADNSATPSPGGTTPDFVEVYNPGKSAVLLAGWSLTDAAAVPAKWSFPAQASIPAKGYLVVWLDSRNDYAGLINTNFALRNSGEEVVLSRNLVAVDAIHFGPQIKNRSLGRSPSGGVAWTLGLPTPGTANQSVSLGLASALRINELLATNSTGDDWLELYNPPDNGPAALGGLVLADVPQVASVPGLWPNSFIDSGAFLELACVGSTNRGDRLDFKLSSTSGETVYLYDTDRTTLIDQLSFGPQARDVSIGRLPDGGPDLFLFEPAGRATPGDPNDWLPLTNVVVNEVLTHTDPPLEDAVELLNLTDADVDLSGWWLSNSREQPLKFRIPDGTVIPARGFRVFFEQAGSGLPGFNRSGTGDSPDFTFNSAHGDEVVLTAATATSAVSGARSARDIPAAANGVALSRHVKSDGGTDLVPESARTFGHDAPATLAEFRSSAGLRNAHPLVGPLVITEIMHHPPDTFDGPTTNDNTLDEFLELTNLSADPLPLFDPAHPTNTWGLRGGISFVFPSPLTLAPHGTCLLVGFDPRTNAAQLELFRYRYQVAPDIPVFGPFDGRLANLSDSLTLYRPDAPQLPPRPDAGYVPALLVEKVNFDLAEGWPAGAANTGLSLHRRDPRAYGNDPTNWFAAAPTPGRAAPSAVLPTIEVQPASAVVRPGDSAVFSVSASGSLPLRYQWRREGADLPGGTNLSLVLTPVRPDQAGDYDVRVSNDAGAVVSAVAHLTVAPPPRLLDLVWNPTTGFSLSLGPATGPAVELLGSSNLRDWTVIARLTNAVQASALTDPAATGLPQRFYRSRIVAD